MTWLKAAKEAALVTGFITLVLATPIAFIAAAVWLVDGFGLWATPPLAVLVMFIALTFVIKAEES